MSTHPLPPVTPAVVQPTAAGSLVRGYAFNGDLHVSPKEFNQIVARSVNIDFDRWMTEQFGIGVDQSVRLVVVYSHPKNKLEPELVGEPSAVLSPDLKIPHDQIKGMTQEEADAHAEMILRSRGEYLIDGKPATQAEWEANQASHNPQRVTDNTGQTVATQNQALGETQWKNR